MNANTLIFIAGTKLDYGLLYWTQALSLGHYLKQYDFVSSDYNEWNVTIKKRSFSHLARPAFQYIKQNINLYKSQQQKNSGQGIKIQTYPQLKNIKQCFELIHMKIKYSQKQLKQRLGFWQVQNFKVYNRQQKQYQIVIYFSFQTKQYTYAGKYTGQKN